MVKSFEDNMKLFLEKYKDRVEKGTKIIAIYEDVFHDASDDIKYIEKGESAKLRNIIAKEKDYEIAFNKCLNTLIEKELMTLENALTVISGFRFFCEDGGEAFRNIIETKYGSNIENYSTNKPQENEINEPEAENYVPQEENNVIPVQNENVTNIQNTNSQNTVNVENTTEVKSKKKYVSKAVYCLLALFLGGLGIHKFYAGKYLMGILYLVFCWTYIPAIIGFIEFLIGLTTKKAPNGKILV